MASSGNDLTLRDPAVSARATIAALVPVTFWYAMHRWISPDEVEALHTAWLVGAGRRIFVDFFQHHNPLLYPILAPVPHLFGAAESVLVGRLAMFVLLLGTAGLTALLAGELFGRGAAERAAGLLLATPFFVARAIEVRPDAPQAAFAALGLWTLFRGLRLRSTGALAISGAAFGIAFAFLQKTGVLLAPVLVVLALHEWRRPGGIRRVAAFGAAALVPPLLVVLWMAVAGSLHAYFRWNFLLVADAYGNPGAQLEPLLRNVRFLATTSPIAILLFAAALTRGAWTRPRVEALLLFASVAGLFLLTGRHLGQDYLPVLPLAIAFAADGLRSVFGPRPRAIAATLTLAGLLAAAHYVRNATRYSNRVQLEQIHYVTVMADPGERVHDPAPLFNVARPDLDFFWYQTGNDDWMGAWRRVHGYDYDLGALVERYRPVIIDRVWMGEDSLAPAIVDWYDPVPGYPDVLVRRPVPRSGSVNGDGGSRRGDPGNDSASPPLRGAPGRASPAAP